MGAYGQCRLHSATLSGVNAIPVDVEVSIGRGIPTFSIVGMPDTAVQEARERVKLAISSSGFRFPGDKIIVNLAPGSIKKAGTGFDLPIALGILAATGQIDMELLRWRLYVGELALDGEVREVPGLLAHAICAHEEGLDFVTAAKQEQLVQINGLSQFGLSTLSEIFAIDEHPCSFLKREMKPSSKDFSDIFGHDMAKRAFQIAAAGGHGLLMIGPPGSGKTMLASRMPSILPPLSEDEAMETAVIHSVSGQKIQHILEGQRPFRAPHHTASSAGLIGGGHPVKPGEVSLAHNGVLFLDELAEFSPSVMQGLRQPLESGSVTITRADSTLVFPARFQLIAASNPCPCGHYGDEHQTCECSLSKVISYRNRIGGPVLDRIDMRIDVGRLEPQDVLSSGKGISSAALREGVLAAREFRSWRLSRGDCASGEVSELVKACRMDEADRKLLEESAKNYQMSGRGIVRTLNIARSISDIEQSESVCADHIYEAIGLRISGMKE